MKTTNSLPHKNRTVAIADVVLFPKRRCGNTTRIVDKVIQDLFNGKLCRVCDDYPSKDAQRRILKIILTRLQREHRHVYDNNLYMNEEMVCIWLDFTELNKL